MIIDPKAIVKFQENNWDARLEFKDGILTLNIDGYILENYSSLSQHWVISDHSFDRFGNKYNFDFTDSFLEITNFSLEFRFNPLLIGSSISRQIELFFFIKYHELNQEINLCSDDKEIELRSYTDLEETFQKLDRILSKSNSSLKSCFGCALSGYEKGGVTLFCMKKNKELLRSKPYIEQYQRHFAGLEKEVVTELFNCHEFELDIFKSKSR